MLELKCHVYSHGDPVETRFSVLTLASVKVLHTGYKRVVTAWNVPAEGDLLVTSSLKSLVKDYT